jgi:hypothetical protein
MTCAPGTDAPMPGMPTAERVAAEFFLPAKEAAKDAAAAASEAAGGDGAAPAKDAPPPLYEIPRQRREAELDAKVRERREMLLNRLRDRTSEFNSLLVDPKLRWQL